MKKTIIMIAAVLCTMLISHNTASAAFDPGMTGTAGVAVATGAATAYEASVISRIGSRAGAATPGGAKGIVFEVLYCDAKNTLGSIKSGIKTILSPSSIDEVADLVSINKAGETVARYQCKDGISKPQIGMVLKQVQEGKYASAELVGTKEFASLFNKKATETGVTQLATDSGISTKTTSRIANRALGINTSLAQKAADAAKASGVAVAITAVASGAESIIRGDDVYEAVGNMLTDCGISAASVAVGTVSAAELSAILTAIGVSATVATASSAVVGVLVPVAGGYALYLLADKYDVEATISDWARNIGAFVSEKNEAVWSGYSEAEN